MIRWQSWVIALGFLVTFCWPGWAALTYAGEFSRFEAKIRREVRAADLQAWAEGLLRQYSVSNATDITYEVTVIPDYIERLSGRNHFSMVVPRPSGRDAFVRIIWGSGMRGHWGLHIGSTNFVDPDTKSEAWRPGLYFWRDYRP